MTFWYMPRSLDTNFLVVYEPCRVLEGLRGVEFQGKNCLTKHTWPDFNLNGELYLQRYGEQNDLRACLPCMCSISL